MFFEQTDWVAYTQEDLEVMKFGSIYYYFDGTIESSRFIIGTCVIQDIRPTLSNETLLSFVFFPKSKQIQPLTKVWRKVLATLDLDSKEDRSLIRKLSRRMCLATYDPSWRKRADKKLQAAYQANLANKIRFKKPKLHHFVHLSILVSPSRFSSRRIEMIFAYVPVMDQMFLLWKEAPLSNKGKRLPWTVTTDFRKKILRQCISFWKLNNTVDSFEEVIVP